MSEAIATSDNPPEETTPADPLAEVRAMIRTCIQCGTCTGSCPNAFAMDSTPRRLWRMVMMDMADEIFAGKTFALCSACYCCTLRCPRGLPLTEAMAALKQAAVRCGKIQDRRGALFYKQFIASVRRHGRLRELEFMTLYFNDLKNPLVALSYAPLGLRLMGKGKVALQLPSRGTRPLENLFHNVAKLEARE